MRQRLVIHLSLALISISASTACVAQVYFQENFDRGSINSEPNPKWSWKPRISANNLNGMMIGVSGKDIYAVSDERSFSGQYALRLNFTGRNNFCNLCGSEEVAINAGNIATGCISISGGPWHSVLYNKSNGFSTWAVTSSTNNQVCFDTRTAVDGPMFGQAKLADGDLMKIPYQCGVNGTIGGSKSRRSDCNRAINYLDGVASSDFDFGATISRRFYLYIPSATTLPNTTLKLGYSHYRRDGKRRTVTLKLSVQRGLTIELTAPGGKVTNPFSVAKDQWYYFEEVFTRESATGVADGRYELYVAPAGQAVTGPLLSQENIIIGSILDMSINGNFQHFRDATGYIYFDDIIISDAFVGPSGAKIPSAPTAVQVIKN